MTRIMVEIDRELSDKLDEVKKEYGSRKNWLVEKAIEHALQHPVTIWGWSNDPTVR